ncbi:MAG: cation:dicarboxylase symporter family transporter [Methylococcaceae bacterium]|nr:cation:dicarboxylase symporter family transporter [Methylococcaceae bacterium]
MIRISLLLSPWLILASVIAGALIGIFNNELATELLPFGSLYLKFLQMLVLPMLITAVISGLGNLFISGMTKAHITKILIFLFIGLILASLLGVLFGYLGEPGSEMQHDAKVTLGKTIIETESSVSAMPGNDASSPGLFTFVQAMIPSNIFTALNRGDNLSILFFSILVGVSMGLMNTTSSKLALSVVDAFFEVFLRIIGWLMYLLPAGLLCLFAGQIAQVGIEIVWATAQLILYIYIACIIVMAAYSFVVWWQSRATHSYLESLAALKQPLLVALGTSSSLATIPAALSALKENLNAEKNTCDLLVPLGFTINPPGTVLHFSIASVFIAQLYGTELGMSEMSIILVGSILAGLAASSAPGVVGLSMIAMTLDPLGLPTNIAIILLVAIDPIVDPILTAVNVHANCAMTMMAQDEEVGELDSQSEFMRSMTKNL